MLRTVALTLTIAAVAATLQGCASVLGSAPHSAKPVAAVSNAQCGQLLPFVASNEASLTRDVFESRLKTDFVKWDKDGSTGLGSLEVEALNDNLRAQNNGASPVRDWNADGKVSFQEFAGNFRTMFDFCDANQDEIVSASEMQRNPNVAPQSDKPRLKPSKPAGKPTTTSPRPQGHQ